MWQRLRTEERGSLSVVTVCLLAVVMLVAAAIIEVTWQTYIRNTIQDTLNYAAEAGGHFRDGLARVQITRYHLYEVDREVCDGTDAKGKPVCHIETEVRRTWSYPMITEEESALKARWRQLFECSDAWTGWECVGVPRVDRRWIEFTPTTEVKAMTTFKANWTNRPAATVTEVTATPLADSQMVIMMAHVHTQPLFLRFLPQGDYWMKGVAGVPLAPLKFE
jgi:hypothetical protein